MQLEIPVETVEAAVTLAAAHGTRVILNPAPARTIGDEILQHVSVVTPNRSEAELLTGLTLDHPSRLDDVALALFARGVDVVLVTLGGEGFYVATTDIRERIPAFEVQAEDTTAAGDVFNGALAVALSEEMPLQDAARFASAAAAISVTRRGAQPSAPHREEILQML